MTATTPDAFQAQRRLMFAKTVFVDEAIPIPKSTRTPDMRPRTIASSWWAIMLCGLVAGFFTGAAVFASPIGSSPSLQRITTAIVNATQ